MQVFAASFSWGDDPLARALAPPPNESDEERTARMNVEIEAKRISDKIDEELQRQEKVKKKEPRPVKILLLGQSESGKSTTLKNFQLMNSPKAFRSERASWRAVIHLNVVRSIRLILDAMTEAQADPEGSSSGYPRLTTEHLMLKMQLSPLVQVEEALARKLVPSGTAAFDAARFSQDDKVYYTNSVRSREVAVNSQFAWKGIFSRFVASTRQSFESDASGPGWENMDDTGRVICACREDMIRLWNDATIQALLHAQHLKLEDMPGFFLDSLDRVASPKYVPTDDDILRARLKTLGVTEYRFMIKDKTLTAALREWRIYDVGGHRSSRAAWAPFFDDMDAILFLAPISAFNQTLEEDPNVNRLEDSILLWKSIIANPLLAETSIVLFLNKVDIFKAKLEAGVKLSRYIVSYGNRPNDYESTSNYLRRKFGQVLRDHSPQPRYFYFHFTTVTDTKTTSTILRDVQDTVVLKSLQKSNLIE
ncbi:Guanine nucleotide-binding protein alpha-4 subunit [Sparassis crispa]|uniref:Guanine nucleotide-binding protein alpha-4 subunit n=1 Tax=Sparassis crispa TaxID=139825 RepID=A0A401GZI2_9APHY|nr:Guanine nucleotide-binding protein alpha-4 subunit [Sparassis crispa]GBE87573.1 Guanine nucleotide-binding protein alpha-4 subunit [Sparassis crispa]